jgi:diguanylate cyclase (GGDEF)-like protein
LKAKLLDAVARTTSHRDRDELDAAVAQLLFDHLEPARITVYRLVGDDDDRKVQRRLSLVAGAGPEGPAVGDPATLPKVSEMAHWHECVLLKDVADCCPPSADDSLDRLCSALPVFGERDVSGIVEIESSGRRGCLGQREVRLVTGVLRILHNHLAALDYGERDQLTGLLNRRTFEALFGKLCERTRKLGRTTGSQSASWLAVLDVDRFKSINDSHGHLFGDEVLLLLARLMNETFRMIDQIFRFGGEEFVVVIDGADEPGAARALERFRAKVEQFRFPQVGRATVSIGYTQISPDDVPASAVARADAALYYAKQNGRNRSDCHESLVRAGLIARKEERSEVELF